MPRPTAQNDSCANLRAARCRPDRHRLSFFGPTLHHPDAALPTRPGTREWRHAFPDFRGGGASKLGGKRSFFQPPARGVAGPGQRKNAITNSRPSPSKEIGFAKIEFLFSTGPTPASTPAPQKGGAGFAGITPQKFSVKSRRGLAVAAARKNETGAFTRAGRHACPLDATRRGAIGAG